MDNRILVIDDEQDFVDSVRRGLLTFGFTNMTLETDPRKAVERFSNGETADIALIDVCMPNMDGIELLGLIRRLSPTTECIMVSALNEAKVAAECLKKGAYNYLVKPVSRDDLVLSINHALERKKLLDLLDLGKKDGVPRLKKASAFRPIITKSHKMYRVLKEAELHARSNVPILITGESGTGKELLAKAIHKASSRAEQPFTPVNMASINGNLFDAEFFGHTRGAFTGAERERVGYLEYTGEGTLFLDEVGTLPLDLQGKLLRVFQEGEYFKLGASKNRKTDVRFITATNVDLEQMMKKGIFRKDLFYRLRGAWLHLGPLRERKEDIPLLIGKFMKEFNSDYGRDGIDDEAMSLLMDFEYPGNVRELRSLIQSAVNLAQGAPISTSCLPKRVLKKKRNQRMSGTERSEPIDSLAAVEKRHILRVYSYANENKARTSQLLDVSLNTLRRKLKCYGMA